LSGDKESDFAVSTGLDATTTPPALRVQYDQRLPHIILLTSSASFFAVQIVFITRWATPPHPAQFSCALATATAVFALHLSNCSPDAERWPTWLRSTILLGQAVATYLPLLAFGIMWTGMTSFLTGSVLLFAARWKAWVSFAAITLSTFAAAVATRQGAFAIACTTVSGPAFGIVLFGLSRLELLAAHAHAAQAEIAQLAVIKERTRFACDLHDLLGFSLTAISLKAELSRRVMDTKPDLAREELADVVDFARQAVTDVRLVSVGYRAMSLAREARSVASLFAAAEIVADIDIGCGLLDREVDTVLATVLREAATNLLRHSAARTCRVTASKAGESVTLLVANDGAPKPDMAYRYAGGLENLATRLETVGGTLTTESEGGTFVLVATVPHAVYVTPGTSDDATWKYGPAVG
jgi:two-component system, NarL family, sensor histidine kinase DesK